MMQHIGRVLVNAPIVASGIVRCLPKDEVGDPKKSSHRLSDEEIALLFSRVGMSVFLENIEFPPSVAKELIDKNPLPLSQALRDLLIVNLTKQPFLKDYCIIGSEDVHIGFPMSCCHSDYAPTARQHASNCMIIACQAYVRRCRKGIWRPKFEIKLDQAFRRSRPTVSPPLRSRTSLIN
jgi:hypothetical protein